MVVPTRLDDVNLPTLWPLAIRIVDGQKPDGGPQPVTSGQLGFDLDTAILDHRTSFSVDAAALDRVHNGVVCCIGADDTIGPEGGGAGAGVGQVDDAIVLDEVLVLERRLDVEHAVLNEYVLVGDGGFLELTVAEATHFGSFCPDFVIEAIGEVVSVDWAVRVDDDGLQTIPDEEAGKADADEQADQRYNRHPLLTRIFCLGPWPFDLAFLDPSRMEITL